MLVLLAVKEGIHPTTNQITASCICGAEFIIESTLDSLRVEICSNCHPFYAGTDKVIDTAGRIDKFKNKYSKQKTSA